MIDIKQLINAYPRTAATVSKWASDYPWEKRTVLEVQEILRDYASKHGYSSSDAVPLVDLLEIIESRLSARPSPLTDRELEQMRWSYGGAAYWQVNRGYGENPVNAHNADIDRLASEIRRLRAKCGEVGK
jgi:hypothetical protein